MGQSSAGMKPYNLNFKNLTCFCPFMLEHVWMKEQDCLISVLRQKTPSNPQRNT